MQEYDLKKIISFGFIFMMMVICGCASSTVGTREAVSIPRTIKLNSIQGEASQFVDRFLQPLKDSGFRFGETDDPDAALLLIKFDPNVLHTAFEVTLKKGAMVVIRSEASNSGWGTGIARSQALEKLAADVEAGMRKELLNMKITVIEDKSLQAVACTGFVNDERLRHIREKVSLDLEKQSSFSMMINKEIPNLDEIKAIEIWAGLQENCVSQKVKHVLSGGDQIRADQILGSFNDRQTALAELALGKLTYGDFARRMNTISIAEKQARNQREADFQTKLEKEKDRGSSTTSQIQQSAQGAASTYKPTFTRCNRIGTQVFCSSF